MSSCLEKPWLWIILICFIRVVFPLSAGPDKPGRHWWRGINKNTINVSRRGCTYRAGGSSPHSSPSWRAHKGPARFWSSGVLPFCSPRWHPGEGTFPYRSKETFSFNARARGHNQVQTAVKLMNKEERTCWFLLTSLWFILWFSLWKLVKHTVNYCQVYHWLIKINVYVLNMCQKS